MFTKISNTWSLMGDSWQLLKQDKELLLFPALSGLACLVVLASFAIPIISGEHYQPPSAESPLSAHVAYYAPLFVFYVITYFIIVFFNAAIIACVRIRVSGGDPTLADGLRAAASRAHIILGWAIIAATVGLILRIIEDRSRTVGRIVAALLGAAWTMISYLVVPALVLEDLGPVAALKRSATLLKQTWGDQLIANFSFGAIFFLLAIPVFVLIAFAAFLANSLTIPLIIIAVIAAILLALAQATLATIFQAALYLYSQTNNPIPGFNPQSLKNAITYKE